MNKVEKAPRCSFEICNRRLAEFCFVCQVNGKYYCSEICADRDLQERSPYPVRWQ